MLWIISVVLLVMWGRLLVRHRGAPGLRCISPMDPKRLSLPVLWCIALVTASCGESAAPPAPEEPGDGQGQPETAQSAPDDTQGPPGSTSDDAVSTSSGSDAESTEGDTSVPLDMGSSTDGTPTGPTTDDFEEDSLGNWSRVDPSAAQMYVQDGALVIEPVAETIWYETSTADFAYQLAQGDFMVTTPIDVADETGSGPSPPFRLAGPMLRDPNGLLEDYVFVSLGAGQTEAMIEVKSTDDSISEYFGPASDETAVDLRLCRVGSTVTALVRVPPALWQTLAIFDRDDLPDELQYGMMAYANTIPTGGFGARFEEITMQPVNSLADCSGP